MLDPFGLHRGSANPPLSSGAISASQLPHHDNHPSAGINPQAAVRLNLMSEKQQQMPEGGGSSHGGEVGLLHQTMTLHSQS